MRKYLIFFFIIGCIHTAKADHITGGEMYYTFNSFSNGKYIYNVTLKLFMRCHSDRLFNDPSIVSIFDRVTGVRISDINVLLSKQETLHAPNTDPCITNPPEVCYKVGYYNFTLSLSASVNGYLLVSQVNYRVGGISNLQPNYGLIGATYTAEIPGTSSSSSYPQNNSAHFIGSDLVLVCANNFFSYSFAAIDEDGDKLRYSFCNAYITNATPRGNIMPPPSPPPYESVPYANTTYSGYLPLGNTVGINNITGLISGIAPPKGQYIVTVCVEEIRNGKVIAMQRKDVQINIAACTIAAATLLPQYTLCKNTQSISISNLSESPLIKSYHWQIINATNDTIFNSTASDVSYNFIDTGLYTLKLFINKNQQCASATSSKIKVYPGLQANFNFSGICYNKPTQFIDASTSNYGAIAFWNWELKDISNNTTFNEPSPTYTYTSIGNKNVRLIVNDTKGCADTVLKSVAIMDKPPINLAFKDTLICLHDKVQLQANGKSNFSWTPAINITNANTNAPTVAPAVTTTYYVYAEDQGCKNNDSVKVNVVKEVALQAMKDTAICEKDTVQLFASSTGLHFLWTPAVQLNNSAIANPIAIVKSTTTYTVTANIGSCFAKDSVLITTLPYPIANAGLDTVICYRTSAQLKASIQGNSFLWMPSTTLINPTILNTIVKPYNTTAYILAAYNNKGCTKPGYDTVLITVLPNIKPYAGADTSVIINQPLQLQAKGGIKYVWSPTINLSVNTISNPIAIFNNLSSGIQYKVLVYNEANCVDSAFVTVKVYKTLASIFVPTAFTPNGDGNNDFFRPIMPGIEKLIYFKIYNRWGNIVFSNTDKKGWDGYTNGKQQPPDSYIWSIKAIDYKGIDYYKKGVLVLLR